MCVHTTWPLVKVSPAMAENVMLFFRHQIKNLCFIMLVVLVITVPMSSLPWVDSNHRPHSPQGLVLHRLFRWDVPLLSNTLPIELHDMPYIFILHTSSWQPHQPTTYVAEPIRTIGLAIRIPYFNSFCMLRLCRNHSAFNSHNFPRTYTTTYPYVAAPPQPNALTRKAQGFGNYRSRLLSFLWPYSQPSFMLSFSSPPAIGLFRCRFDSGLRTGLAALAPSILSVISTNDCAYLPGLHAARPSALSDVPESNRPSFLV